jgi:hypothetical protein
VPQGEQQAGQQQALEHHQYQGDVVEIENRGLQGHERPFVMNWHLYPPSAWKLAGKPPN